ncbi:MAG: MBL fold metallo-hydrolase [Erysipelotrichaceae bacterium]
MIEVFKLNNNIYRINESIPPYTNVDAYLIDLNDKAILIDTLEEEVNLLDTVRNITAKPLTVILTHGHPDHAGRALTEIIKNYIPVYMHKEDLFLTEYRDNIKDINELNIEDIEIISCKGHTPGSIIVRYKDNLFTGDAIGSGGFWMQLKESLSLRELLINIKSLRNKLDESVRIYPGHYYQSDRVLDISYLDELIELTEMIINNPEYGLEGDMHLGDTYLKYRKAVYHQIYDYLYNPEKI